VTADGSPAASRTRAGWLAAVAAGLAMAYLGGWT
jgi:hypothetical protein